MVKPRPSQVPPTDLGKLVRMGLLEKDISLKKLAEHLDITYQNLYAILSGKTRLTLTMAKKIADYLNLSVDELANAEETGAQGLELGDEYREAMFSTDAPLPSWRQRRQHIVQMSSQPSSPQISIGRDTLSEPATEREAGQLLFWLLEMIEEGSVPRHFYRTLAEKLKPYLEDQPKEGQTK
jgi:plasmid maintenance system antidote protein VapI